MQKQKMLLLITFLIISMLVSGCNLLENSDENKNKLAGMAQKYLEERYEEEFEIKAVWFGGNENDMNGHVSVSPKNHPECEFYVIYRYDVLFGDPWSGGFEDNYGEVFLDEKYKITYTALIEEYFGKDVKFYFGSSIKGNIESDFKPKDFVDFNEFLEKYADDYKMRLSIKKIQTLNESNLESYSDYLFDFYKEIVKISPATDISIFLCREDKVIINEGDWDMQDYFVMAIPLTSDEKIDSSKKIRDLIKGMYPFLMDIEFGETSTNTKSQSYSDMPGNYLFDGYNINGNNLMSSRWWSIDPKKLADSDLSVKVHLNTPKTFSGVRVFSAYHGIKTLRIDFSDSEHIFVTLPDNFDPRNKHEIFEQSSDFGKKIQMQDIRIEVIDLYSKDEFCFLHEIQFY